MNCPTCGNTNPVQWRFCNKCGTNLQGHDEHDEQIANTPSESDLSLAQLNSDLQELRAEVRDIRRVIDYYAQPAPSKPDPTRTAPGNLTATQNTEQEKPQRSLIQQYHDMDWEFLIGGNWLARIGVLAVVIGAAFFLKLAFDNDWIGDIGSITLGLLGSAGFLAGSQYWQRQYPVYSQALAGGGIALLYLTVFASFAIYEMIGLYPAIGLLLIISITSAGLAVRHESISLAIIGVAGAFTAPFVLGIVDREFDRVAETTPAMYFTVYIIIVDLGVLLLSTFRNWRWLTLIALIASLASFGSWYAQYDGMVSLLEAQGSLTIIFLIFVFATTLFHIIWKRRPEAYDHCLVLLNAGAYFGISCGLMRNDFLSWIGGFTLLLAIFYATIGYLTLVRYKHDMTSSLTPFGITLVLLTISIAMQLSGAWICVAWAAESAVLVWLSFKLRIWPMRILGIGLLLIVSLWLLSVDTFIDLESYLVVLNYRTLAFSSGIIGIYLTRYILHRHLSDNEEWEIRYLAPALMIAASFLTLWLISAEVIYAVDSGLFEVSAKWSGHIKSLGLSLVWAIYASVVLALGIFKKLKAARFGGLLLLSVPIIKLFLYDSFALDQGFRVAAFLILGVILLIGGFLYQRHQEIIRGFLLHDSNNPKAT